MVIYLPQKKKQPNFSPYRRETFEMHKWKAQYGAVLCLEFQMLRAYSELIQLLFGLSVDIYSANFIS